MFEQSSSRHWARRLALAAGGALATALATTVAFAHPHVWVNVRTAVVYENGNIVGFRHVWAFDEGYSAMAIEGLDVNKDGTYDRQELAELAKINVDGLSEFGYFTYAKLGERAVEVAAPRDYWLDHATIKKDGEEPQPQLTLTFFLPLKKPVLSDAPGFVFEVFDPSFFIAFELAKDNAITLADAPAGCAAKIGVAPADSPEAAKLGDAFVTQFGGDMGMAMSQAVAVTCPAAGPKAG
ncbi:MAG: DUF1007 family protein [Hyphomicrobiaceae bacterium]|nr:DUF1007 family protein [Hyphomicrobiaceae bacterium]